jgi:hypothetical protein
MNIPAFTAEASLYMTSNRYLSSSSEYSGPLSSYSIVPAYMPGPATQRECSVCTGTCDKLAGLCGAGVAATVAAICVGTLGFGCAGAVAWGGAILANCAYGYAGCIGLCNVPSWVPLVGGYCCPKICGLPNPLEGSGSGCCDLGEACVDQGDPNSRQGCCPSGQSVCGGKCCAIGEYCCGDTCCGDPHCFNDVCGNTPPFPDNPPPPPPNKCSIWGGQLCGTKCCPIGTWCCGVFSDGQPDCRLGSTINACLH